MVMMATDGAVFYMPDTVQDVSSAAFVTGMLAVLTRKPRNLKGSTQHKVIFHSHHVQLVVGMAARGVTTKSFKDLSR